MADVAPQAGSWTDLDITVDVSHGLSARDAALRLQALEGLTMQRCTVQLAGSIEVAGVRFDLKGSMDIGSGNVSMHLTGTKPWIVPQAGIKTYVTNLLRKALQ